MAKRKREAGEINAGSMADIAFLLLIFFLVTTTMDIDSGLIRRLPPMPDEHQKQDDAKINRRNIMVVLVNSRDHLSAGGQPMDIKSLKNAVKEFVQNPSEDPRKAEKEIKEIDGLGPYPVSKAVISLQNARGTSYNVYISIQNELVAAFNELRDELSLSRFGKVYERLSDDQQQIVRKAIPQNISEAEPVDVDIDANKK
ncbi:MAG: biopolymer transporter ExbD [Prevotellaceae bacterium]|jgi:biopolymer transport protein ExbD|nr:biopolymer transporter ExbD [Prevotellaceae bacterium]